MVEPTKTPRSKKEIQSKPEEEQVVHFYPEERDNREEKKSLLSRLAPILLSIIAALIVSYYMINTRAVPAGTFNSAFADVGNRLATVEANTDDTTVNFDAITTTLDTLRNDLDNIDTVSDSDVESLNSRIDELETLVSNLNFTISYDEVTGLKDVLDNIKEDIEELKTAKEEEIIAISTTTRWSVDIAFEEDYGTDITLDTSIKPTRVEEEDTYRIKIDILNSSTTVAKTISDAILSIILIPNNKDTYIDASNTFIDSASSPYLDWEADFRPEPVSGSVASVDCRRIELTSEEFNFTVPIATTTTEGVVVPGAYTLKLDFDLAYMK